MGFIRHLLKWQMTKSNLYPFPEISIDKCIMYLLCLKILFFKIILIKKATPVSCKNNWDTVRHLAYHHVSMFVRFPFPSPSYQSCWLDEQLWKGEREGLCVVSHRFLSSSDFQNENMFLIGNVSTILQLVVHKKIIHKHITRKSALQCILIWL